MDIEAFPEIENFQKLPKKVIVKAGNTHFDSKEGTRLQGIVINNCGNAICKVRVHIVIFNDKRLPIFSSSLTSDPDHLPQGGIGNFSFLFKDHHGEIADYHLYTSWRFDE